MKNNLKYRVDIEQIAELIIHPIIHVLDVALTNKPEFLDTMKNALEKMEDHASTARAFPFPATQNKADELELQNATFEKIIELAKIRKNFIDYKNSGQNYSDGIDVLKHLGLS